MRQAQPDNNYAAGTKIDSHRSRAELERILLRYGASDFAILEHDADASIGFALHGRYVQYVLPLPELDDPSFSHTPTGRPRALEAQERAYEQAVRQQWRRAVLVMRGKLEAVESGLSSFEREFYGAIAEETKRDRPAALLLRRKLRWAPETMMLILCLGVFVPSAGGLALGLPVTAVDRVTSPLWGDQPDPLGETIGSDKKAPTVKLALRSAPTGSSVDSTSSDGGVASHESSSPGQGSSHGGHSEMPKPGSGGGGSNGNGHGNGNGSATGQGNGNGNAYGHDKGNKGGGNGKGGTSVSTAAAGPTADGNGNGNGHGNGNGAGQGNASASQPADPPKDKDKGNKGGAGGASGGKK